MSRICGTIDLDRNFDLSEVFDEISDDELIAECERRRLAGVTVREAWRELADDIRLASRSDPSYLDVLLIRMLELAGVPRLRIPSRSPLAQSGMILA